MLKQHSAKKKAGRQWIAAIVDGATRVFQVEIDLITEERTEKEIDLALFRGMVEIEGRTLVLHEVTGNEFVWLQGGVMFAKKLVIRTYAFDVTDLPEG